MNQILGRGQGVLAYSFRLQSLLWGSESRKKMKQNHSQELKQSKFTEASAQLTLSRTQPWRMMSATSARTSHNN